MINFLKWLVSQYLRWKNPDPIMGWASKLLIIGAGLQVPTGLLAIATLKLPQLPIEFELGFQAATMATGVGLFLMLVSVPVGIFGALNIRRLAKTIVILHRGMDGMNVASPEKDLPTRYKIGQLDYVNIPSQLPDVNSQFTDIEGIPRDIHQRITQIDHGKVNLLYCGLAPIPLLFFAGYKMQVREKVEVMEYQRSPQKWVFMDEPDDNESIKIRTPDSFPSSEVAISVSFSFDVNTQLIRDKLGANIGVIEIELDGGARMDSLLSSEKQNRVLMHIVESLVKQRSKNPIIETYHLFMSAQASFAVNFGRHWTTSVLPSVQVYNFDSKNNSYAWSVQISHDSAQLNDD